MDKIKMFELSEKIKAGDHSVAQEYVKLAAQAKLEADGYEPEVAERLAKALMANVKVNVEVTSGK